VTTDPPRTGPRRLWIPDRGQAAAFLVAFAIGLGALALAGRAAASVNHFERFVRFHRYLNPETSFYPTASEVIALARASARPDQTLIIVGGNSIVFGSGQPNADVWSRELALLLGERYGVVNLALPAGVIGEHGTIAAEALVKEGRSVILVAPGYPVGAIAADGRTYPYVTWDAEAKGLRLRSTAREAALSQPSPAGPAADVARVQLRSRALLDSVLYFSDLWQAIGYHRVFTLWQPLLPPGMSFWSPRVLMDDPIQEIRREQYYPPQFDEESMRAIRTELELSCAQQPDGSWELRDDIGAWSRAVSALDAALSPPLRPRTLLLVTLRSPHFTQRLTAAEQRCHHASFERARERLTAAGYRTIMMGDGWATDDYVDWLHPSADGGRKLAVEVAREVRELAARAADATGAPAPP
jgi:hypothetical protein